MSDKIKTFDKKPSIFEKIAGNIQNLVNLAFIIKNESTPPSQYGYFTNKTGKGGKKWKKR